ncbi:MAG TPA: hypothetical protein VGJ58_01975 [Gaiellaceae bacterium]
MRITRQSVARRCAVCERTLLVGEKVTRYSPDGDNYVDVCALCQDLAVDSGWLKEGSPTTPTVSTDRPRRRLSLGSLFEGRKTGVAESPVADEPILRRLSGPELAVVEAADLFNHTDFRRTVAGIAKSLGEPRISIRSLSGVSGEVVVTVAWDISWYQYRVTPESAQPVRLHERGHELAELDAVDKNWNAHLDEHGRLVPNIARV